MRYILFTLLICYSSIGLTTDDRPEFTQEDFPRWIEEFKLSEKGPFEKTLWYCRDGTVLPPDPGA